MTVAVFFLLNHFSREIWCYIRLDFVGFFPLIIQHSNLDGGTLTLDPPRIPYNLSTGYNYIVATNSVPWVVHTKT